MTNFIRIDFNGTETTLDRDELIDLLSDEYREELGMDIDGQVEDYESDLGGMGDGELAKEYRDRTDGQIRIQGEDDQE